MKNFERIILIAVVVVPIIICVVLIKNIWSDEKEPLPVADIIDSVSEPYYKSGDEIIPSGEVIDISGESGDVRTLGGTEFVTKIGAPISKIYSDATTSAALANVYLEADEQSEVVGKLEKHTKVTAQKYEQNWSRVTGQDNTGVNVSGWLKTENITYPDDATQLVNDKNAKTGTVTTKDTSLNVRKSATSKSDIVTTVSKGATVVILDTVTETGTSKNWYKITVNGITGWVSADYVKLK